jgi:hypothetical protein
VYEKERAMTLTIQEPVTGHEEISVSGEPLAALGSNSNKGT